MNKRQLKALLAVNLRLVNPQVTDRYRKKGKNGSDLTRKLQLQFFINTLVFIFIYGATMFSFDFSKLPGMFTFYVTLFVLLALSQSISGIYNIFFAGKDLDSYLPLPFRQKEIFFSKILIVSSNVIPFTLPLLIVFFLTGWRSGIMIPLALLLAIVVYVLVLAIILFACSLIVFGLTKTSLFRNHQSVVMNLLIAVTTVIAVGGILMMNGNQYSETGASLDRTPIAIFMPLFQIFKDAFSLASGGAWLGLLALLLVFGGLLKYIVLPHLNEQLTLANTASVDGSKKHKRVQRSGLKQILDSYNFQLLKEPNLLLQVLSNSIMMPIIFIFSFAFAKVPNNLPVKWLGVFFVAGIAFSGMTINQSSLIGNLISLDRMNFEFVKSLPISLKKYLQRKFLLGYIFQLIINTLILIVATIILKLSLAMLVALICGSAWGTYLISQHYFRRDYKLRLTNWTNVTQLFSRGGGNLGMVTTIFVSIIVGVTVILGYSAAIALLPQAWMINTIVAIIIIILSVLILKFYQQKFWKQFD